MRFRSLIFAAILGAIGHGGPARADLIYVAREDNTITRIDTVTGAESVFASTYLSNPHGMAFDAAGNLFVANSGDHWRDEQSVQRDDRPIHGRAASAASSRPQNAVHRPAYPTSGRPLDVAFDAAGNLVRER